MRTLVIGNGRTALATATALAQIGNEVICARSLNAVAASLETTGAGEETIELLELYREVIATRALSESDSLVKDIASTEAIVIAEDVENELWRRKLASKFWASVTKVALFAQPEAAIVLRGIVPPGTNRQVATFTRLVSGRTLEVYSYPVITQGLMNIGALARLDRIVIGCEQSANCDTVRNLFAPFHKCIELTSPCSAESQAWSILRRHGSGDETRLKRVPRSRRGATYHPPSLLKLARTT